MKSFYGAIYIEKEILEANHIYHPVRLDYYKVEKEEEHKLFYGIEIVKTEYKTEKPEIEANCVEQVTTEEREIIEILEKFKLGSVMPEVLEEMIKEEFQNTKELCW